VTKLPVSLSGVVPSVAIWTSVVAPAVAIPSRLTAPSYWTSHTVSSRFPAAFRVPVTTRLPVSGVDTSALICPPDASPMRSR
jgi:hypothetical protein